MTDHAPLTDDELAASLRSFRVPDIRIAMNLAWWERVVESLRWRGQPIAERWEWRAEDGWKRYWRRDGSIPHL